MKRYRRIIRAMQRMASREGVLVALVALALVIARVAHDWVGHDTYGLLAGFLTFHLIAIPALISSRYWPTRRGSAGGRALGHRGQGTGSTSPHDQLQ